MAKSKTIKKHTGISPERLTGLRRATLIVPLKGLLCHERKFIVKYY